VHLFLGVLEPQRCLDPRLQLHDAERLGNIVIRSGQQQFRHLVRGGTPRKHDDLQVRVRRGPAHPPPPPPPPPPPHAPASAPPAPSSAACRCPATSGRNAWP